MSQASKKHWWHSEIRKIGPSNMEHVDAYILSPIASQESVKRLLTDPAWAIASEEPELVIFVRSTSECIV